MISLDNHTYMSAHAGNSSLWGARGVAAWAESESRGMPDRIVLSASHADWFSQYYICVLVALLYQACPIIWWDYLRSHMYCGAWSRILSQFLNTIKPHKSVPRDALRTPCSSQQLPSSVGKWATQNWDLATDFLSLIFFNSIQKKLLAGWCLGSWLSFFSSLQRKTYHFVSSLTKLDYCDAQQ